MNTPVGKDLKEQAIESLPATDAVKKSMKKQPVEESIAKVETAKEVPLNIEDAVIKQKQEQKNPPSPKDGFLSAIGLFLPTLIGGLAGTVIGGPEAGAAALTGGMQGMETGMKMTKGFQDLEKGEAERKLIEAKTEAVKNPKEDDLAKARLEISKGQLELRREEIRLARQRRLDIEEDRRLRREERDIERSIKLKHYFHIRPEIKKIKDAFVVLDTMEDILNHAPKIAVGTIPTKIAKGIAGEVGVLTNEDIERAQIEPSFMNSLRRRKAKFLEGGLPPRDVVNLRRLVNALRKKKKERTGQAIYGYAKSNKKHLTKNTASTFTQDLFNDFGIDLAILEKIKEEEAKKAAKEKAKKTSKPSEAPKQPSSFFNELSSRGL